MAGDTSLSAFEAIKHVDDEGGEWWSARELGKLLGYDVWRNFAEVIDEAKEVCRLNGGNVDRIFAAVVKNSSGESKRGRKGTDYRLTRHA